MLHRHVFENMFLARLASSSGAVLGLGSLVHLPRMALARRDPEVMRQDGARDGPGGAQFGAPSRDQARSGELTGGRRIVSVAWGWRRRSVSATLAA